MGHAHHFLERLDRVTRDQTDFALSLYRDDEALTYVLSHVNLPPDATRVALALGAGREGPFVLVTRDGKFVTCLGKEMRHDHPVVPRGQLDALLAKVQTKRTRRELAQRELRPDEKEEHLFQRVFTRGNRLTREDFLALSAFEPFLGEGPFCAMVELGMEAITSRAALVPYAAKMALREPNKKGIESLDRVEWATAHLAVLAGAGDKRSLETFLTHAKTMQSSATVACSGQAGSTFYLRAAWLAARFGKAVIPAYRDGFSRMNDWLIGLDAALGLGAIAIRHASARGELLRFFESFGPAPRKADTPEELRALLANGMIDTIQREEVLNAGVLNFGRDVIVLHGQQLPAGHPRRYETRESVPEELARTAVLGFDGDIFDDRMRALTLQAMPLAARAAAEDFYLPRELVRLWYGAWTHEEGLLRLQRYAGALAKEEPVRAQPVPGRNDPCTCGSGKKWKRCHGL